VADTAVFDTNILISALLWHGAAYQAVLLAKAKMVRTVYCDAMLAELTEKLREKFEFDENHIEAIVYQTRQYAERVEIPGTLRGVAQDPDDDKFIECALVSGARWIVSGDRHLLTLGEYQNIRILNAQSFVAECTGQK
jgi:putative PIN family toxin of toxin-antitoxin system